jgi:photosystem II stability/assembly factor-like uncharacterized protein
MTETLDKDQAAVVAERKKGRDTRIIEVRQAKPHWDMRRAFADRLMGTSDRAVLQRAVAAARRQQARMRSFERREADPELKFSGQVEVVGAPKGAIKLELAKNPGAPTFGGTGRFVQLAAKECFSAATLLFRLDTESIKHLEPETILAARWDAAGKRLRLLPQSGYNEDMHYVYARVSRPGIYTAVGMPRDPRIRTTLELIYALGQWRDLDSQFDFNRKICQVILCNPDMQQWVQDFIKMGNGMEGFSPRDFAGGIAGGDLCEMCFGLGGHGGPVELDLLDLLERPPYVVKPWPLPPKFPKPCGKWVSIGPDNVPGRINAMAIHPSNGNIVYAGAAAGGVFKTTNGGNKWYAKWQQQLSLAIGGLAVATSNPNVLYAATGEWEGNVGAANNHFPGVGVYRSSDGGNDWDLLTPIPSANTAGIAIDPTNPNRVFVAGDTSLHRSTNGGASWDVTPGNVNGIFDGIVSDVVMDSNDVNRLYIGVHNSGVWRTTDGGGTWTQLTTGIATGAAASSPKIALGRNGAHGTQFIAVKMARRVFTSTDGGNNFTEQANCDVNWAPFYPWANVIAVDPQDEDVLFGGHASIYRSTNGGTSWTQVGGYGMPPVHPDQQSLVFDPTNHDHVYLATDGGIYESTDNGQTWAAKSSGLITTQCWTVGVSDGATLAYGITTQDNACYEWTGTGNSFTQVLGPEGGWIEYDPGNANTLFADTWFANLKKSTDGGTTWSNLALQTDSGHSEALSISRLNGNRLLAVKSAGAVSRSTDGGTTWADTLSLPGMTVSSVTFAPSDDNHAYAASNNGRVWHSGDGGATWTELPNAGLPAVRVHDIEVDWNDPMRVYLAFGALGVRQLWRGEVTPANDAVWADVSGALPAVSLPDLALTGLALHPMYEETLFVSNILGVYRSTDGGESWAPYDEGLPNSFVSDIDVRKHDRMLYVSTMGRGVYRRRA